ncbi:response regulator [Candidatus Poribacteria bacterium]|nr:response regulator [Candidatus Poribacteria bacterium]
MAKTILIVEDDYDIQGYYKIIISDFNPDINLIQAYNGKEALDIIDSNKKINLIILDLKMPIMDGEEFLQILRNKRKLKIPVIVSTVNNISGEKLLKETNIQGFFYKMDKQEDLIKLIDLLLK